MSTRVRYAPSPTGKQHIGGVRTAVFNYLFARSTGGDFILRIEDTDQVRTSEGAIQDLLETLEWLGLDYDEGPGKEGDCGPYVQSERFDLYRQYGRQLLDMGHAYPCFCTAERLDQVREEQKKNKSKEVGYDRHCRDLSSEEVQAKLDAGVPHVLRLKIPKDGETTFHDVNLGDITRKNRDTNPDPILIKSDGFPTYHFANVIDDHLMGITHILRGQEWIPSAPLHIQLYNAFGWDAPMYCHLPMVLGKDGSKLSKRHGATSVEEFRKTGYLPEALMNYLALTGWSLDGETEFFTKEELFKVFSLEKISKSSAVFDYKKLDWFNGQYIRKMDDDKLKGILLGHLTEDGVISSEPTVEEFSTFNGVYPLIKERMKTTSEVSALVRFLFKPVDSYDPAEAVPKKMELADVPPLIELHKEFITGLECRSEEENEAFYREKSEKIGVKLGNLLQVLRVAVTGTRVSPPLFESIRLLGTEETIRRLDALQEAVKGALK